MHRRWAWVSVGILGIGGPSCDEAALGPLDEETDEANWERQDEVEDLLAAGPYTVGFWSTTLQRQEPTGATRTIDVMVWYPAKHPQHGSNAQYSQYVPLPFPAQPPLPPGPLHLVEESLDAALYAEALDARIPADPGPWEPLATLLVNTDPHVVPGEHPVLINLAGGNSPAFVATYEGMQYASHGIVFVSAASQFGPTGTPADLCRLDEDAALVLDTVLAWNDTKGHVLRKALDLDAVFAGGHSLGGRTWLARTSDAPECGLAREDRLAGLILKDATRERLDASQIAGNHVPTFMSSQVCRSLQIDLYQGLASRPMMMMLEGYVHTTGITTGNGNNHALFAQTCMSRFANALDPAPGWENAVPPFRRALCDDENDPTSGDNDAWYVDRERFFAAQLSRYGIAWLKLQTGQEGYAADFLPENVTDPGVAIVPSVTDEHGSWIGEYCPPAG